MSYIFLFILLLPFKLIGKLFYRKSGRNLLIQTAKIGDFVNITPVLACLKHSDVLISKTVLPLAKHDETIDTIYLLEEHKKSFWSKARLALILMNRYQNVYLLQPNSTNLFFAAICNATNKQFLSIYTRRWYHCLFYMTADGVIEHDKQTLTVDSYLKLVDRQLTWRDYPKHATKPLKKPNTWPAELDAQGVIKIGISISAGNKAKTIPPAIWQRLFKALEDLPCRYYIFGAKNERVWMDDLYKVVGEQENFVDLIGQIELEDLPFAIAKMDCYIASDSGNIYIADAVGVPVVVIYGPCSIQEQHPLGDVLLIGDENNICTYIFETRHYFDKPREELFALTDDSLEKIKFFIMNNSAQKIGSESNNKPDDKHYDTLS